MAKSLLSKILISIAACLIIGFLSGMATTDSINSWYVNINKPSFNPPNWIFGPVWSILYTMMGIAAGLIWHEGIERVDVKAALYVFCFSNYFECCMVDYLFWNEKPSVCFYRNTDSMDAHFNLHFAFP